MAIDDNVSYELTGAQVKDLANKIKAKAEDNLFVGATSAIPGSKGLVPAPQAGDDIKFLSGDGTWKTAGGGTLYTTTGQNEDGAMTQKAVTDTIFAGNDTSKVQIGKSASATYAGSVGIGNNAKVYSSYGVSVGYMSGSSNNSVAVGAIANATAAASISVGYATDSGMNGVAIGSSASSGTYGVSVGYRASSNKDYSVALGTHSTTRAQGVVDVSTSGNNGGNYGYQGTNDSTRTPYRVISGVHDGEQLHDVATVAQGNTLSPSAPTTSTVGVLGQLYTDTTNIRTYQLTAIDTTDPDNPVYTWSELAPSSGDTGWLDCTYKSGYTVSSNGRWKKLQARVINGVLYFRGGVSPSSGTFALNTEYTVATLPASITAMITTTSIINSAGRSTSSASSLWSIMEDGSGEVTVICNAGLNGGTGGRTWASPPGCIGLVN